MNIEQWNSIYTFVRARESRLEIGSVEEYESNLDKGGESLALFERLLLDLASCERSLMALLASNIVKDIITVLAIHTDEIVRVESKQAVSDWKLLQESKGGINNGGVYFFDLAEQELAKTSPSIEVLETLYFCLLSGYKGKYFDSESRLKEVSERLQRRIKSIVQRNEYSKVIALDEYYPKSVNDVHGDKIEIAEYTAPVGPDFKEPPQKKDSENNWNLKPYRKRRKRSGGHGVI
ncbi:DotU family type IV/VI secretion system protein [Microbulbifer sp. TRSA001]|uniref:DotU family type IV/VI secretion system protein n=1 Tax=Microbulbifer sp. TRSA001 TaxID=3243381 RepID=UPI00403A4212